MKKFTSLLILLLFSFSSVYAVAFEELPPRRRVQAKKLLQRQKKLKKENILLKKKLVRNKLQRKSFKILGIYTGTFNSGSYSTQEGYYGLEYGIVNPDNFGFRLSAGIANTKNSSGDKLTTIPIDIDVLINYRARAKLNIYGGAGFGYTQLSGAIEEQGLHYQFLVGSTLSLSRQSALYAEFKKYYPTAAGSKIGSTTAKGGIKFNF
jgi:hypothetical protein